MLHLTELGVEVFMKRAKSKAQRVFWKNYDLIIWKKDQGGYSSTKGMYKDDAWGVTETISVNENGTWNLPKKYVKYFK